MMCHSGPGRRASALLAAAGAAGAARAGSAALRRWPPGEAALWERANHAGRPVDLYGGLAAASATVVATGLAPGLPGRVRAAAALATLTAAGCGAYDDQVGSCGPRGFRAHLSALRRGRITSGTVKLLGVGTAALAAGALLKTRPADKLLAGVVVAGTAHLVNLLDVRPGRAAKALLVMGAPVLLRGGVAGLVAAAPVGAAAAVLGDDLGERTMLGDAGAHALGAALGVSAVVANGRAGLALRAAVLVALAAAGERAGAAGGERGGFGETLWDLPGIRAVDALGRRAGQ
ncbi:hypothetical protein QMK28_33265 [Streptomyces sp. H27-D2]|nr:hypothetical protein [Streptomyces sp. H27-D2]MEC4021012.1 hypothetical protein [Streptomyces sp. H27-D2]